MAAAHTKAALAGARTRALQTPAPTPKRRYVLVAAAQAAQALLITGAVAWGLPTRWAPVDWGGALLASLAAISAVGLVAGRRWGVPIARISAGLTLLCGLGLCTALSLSVAYLAGLYGPVGAGGALLLTTVALLLLPYLVVWPLWQLWQLHR